MMGTNYYHTTQEPCEKCGRPYEPRHIGKSSGGWTFALHIYRDEGIKTLEDWIEQFKTGTIHDEYGQEISQQEMVNIITLRRRTTHYAFTRGWLRQNHAVAGPYNLARAEIDGVHCVGYADHDTPVDYFVGDFS